MFDERHKVKAIMSEAAAVSEIFIQQRRCKEEELNFQEKAHFKLISVLYVFSPDQISDISSYSGKMSLTFI